MRDPPDAAALLALAEEAMARDLTAEERSRDAALAARCRDIAERERRSGEAPYAAVAAGLAALYGPRDGAALLAALAAEIRSGALDPPGPRRTQVERLLWALARQRLGESNPEFLAGTGLA